MAKLSSRERNWKTMKWNLGLGNDGKNFQMQIYSYIISINLMEIMYKSFTKPWAI